MLFLGYDYETGAVFVIVSTCLSTRWKVDYGASLAISGQVVQRPKMISYASIESFRS